MKRRQRGFTLIELIAAVTVIGVLAAIALPRFIDFQRDARLASLASLAGTLQAAANNVHTLCATNPQCDFGNQYEILTLAGRSAQVNYGWPDGGDNLAGTEIDIWITYSGFTPTLPADDRTVFTLDGAPDPANCAVVYKDAYYQARIAAPEPLIVTLNTGC